MVVGSKIDMLTDVTVRRSLEDGVVRGSNSNLEDILQNELELILREQHNLDIIDRGRDFNIFRSGSAPPTVEGSLSAVGSLFRNPNFALIDDGGGNADVILSEEEIRSHPAYLSYYYSHENFNPRLPPPLLSREDWRVAQRFQAGGSSFGGIGDWMKKNSVDVGGSSSLFSMQPSLSVQKGEQELTELRRAASVNLSRPSSTEWLNRGSDDAIGMSSAGLGTRRKSFADILQEGLKRPASSLGHLSRPSGHNSLGDIVDTTSISSHHSAELCNGVESATKPSFPRVQSLGSISHSLTSAVAAPLLRSRTPEPQLIRRSPSPGLPPVVNRVCPVEKKNIIGSNAHSGLSSSMTKLSDIASSLSSLSLSKNQLSHEDSIVQSQLQMVLDKPNQLLEMSNGHAQSQSLPFIDKSKAKKLTIPTSYVDLTRKNGVVTEQNVANLGLTGQMNFPQISSANLYSKMSPSGFASLERSNMYYQTDKYSGMDSSGHMPNGCSISKKLNTAGSNHLDTASTLTSGRNGQTLRESGKQAGSDFHSQHLDPMWIQYLQEASDYAMHAAASSGDSPQGRNYFGTSRAHGELQEFRKAYLETLFAQEHGTEIQRKELASQISGHVLPLSLQMYGCRVIQKALEVIDVEQQSQMVAELDGFVMKCVRDQNGNHVIQKSIERVPQDRIQFIILAFFGQIAELSTHPYGCRVIQRVLEHCDDPMTQQTIMDEITHSVCSLAQDQYGNYVIQHVLQLGKPHERSAIIGKLAGQIVKMSQQKFASNVVEKCLTFGGPVERQLLVNEMLGSTDENAPLQAMMKDPYGNYVVQKVLETCNDQSRELILSRIKVHLNTLKKYTYGKHIVSRVEKLITAGERCNGLGSTHSS